MSSLRRNTILSDTTKRTIPATISKTGRTRNNFSISAGRLAEFCPLDDKARLVIQRAFDNLGLSARAYDRILKVVRTIADLDTSEAVRYRTLDRKYWGGM